MIKKLCLIAGLATTTGCYTAAVRTVPVATPVVAPAPSVIYTTTPAVAPVLIDTRPAWGWGWGWNRFYPHWGPGFHHHHHGRFR